MGKKCIVWNCKTGYASQKNLQVEKIPLYKFPKDLEQRRKWVQNIPNKITVEEITENHAVCALHFRNDVPLKKVGRYWAPLEPPLADKNDAPKSQHSTPAPKDRTTKRSHAETRRTANIQPSEYEIFMENDKFKISTFHLELEDRINEQCMIAHSSEEEYFALISVTRSGPLHKFAIYFTLHACDGNKFKEINYEAYAGPKRVRHSLFQNAVTTWSKFDELLRFVRDPSMNGVEAADSTKIDFIQRQVQLLNTPKNQKIYNKNDLYQAFSWYTVSTSLYNRLRSCIQLPAKSTLQNITPDFLFYEVTSVVKRLELCGGRAHAFICDNKRVNQKCFSMFTLKAENSP
ncbi:hypothetical protein PoB_005208200 [Plakobranchus ocellatus]|uniref:THAP-type domain-containing protein n=1 Tax=Plakobranchus ocellatus TaxID=259542 RepID=A0AAV4C2U5_9GAST|nr:hypothetical protein PoB_005208200 [Plakobranchus ocellatus]